VNPHPVTFEICLAFIKRRLKGFRRAPRADDEWDAFTEELQAAVVSVEHMQAVLQTFDEEMPTIRQIRDVAINLRPKFQTPPDQYAEWRRQFGPPSTMRVPVDEMAMHWQAFRDALYYVEGPGDSKSLGFWQASLLADAKDHPDSIAFVRDQARRLGWSAIMGLTSSPEPMPYTPPEWRRRGRGSDRGLALLVAPPPGTPITQSDIDRAREPRKTTEQVDRELDAWDDPDR
jgi:hypothetical protein